MKTLMAGWAVVRRNVETGERFCCEVHETEQDAFEAMRKMQKEIKQTSNIGISLAPRQDVESPPIMVVPVVVDVNFELLAYRADPGSFPW